MEEMCRERANEGGQARHYVMLRAVINTILDTVLSGDEVYGE